MSVKCSALQGPSADPGLSGDRKRGVREMIWFYSLIMLLKQSGVCDKKTKGCSALMKNASGLERSALSLLATAVSVSCLHNVFGV